MSLLENTQLPKYWTSIFVLCRSEYSFFLFSGKDVFPENNDTVCLLFMSVGLNPFKSPVSVGLVNRQLVSLLADNLITWPQIRISIFFPDTVKELLYLKVELELCRLRYSPSSSTGPRNFLNILLFWISSYSIKPFLFSDRYRMVFRGAGRVTVVKCFSFRLRDRHCLL